ncbi:bifunctional diaminohydroxyphosphoribosylaminopyrimidine deaminase/5-amino-6-(5-phosphoribosylamino)uracil reductase RibD [Nonomuraea aurantiaca]|uniref:bifunctional diaminohydroxyphosphoribosylaminopyrimidine deaminase/5-amino-6-(5-phosphoribosylamino)uracil reductase RibD n=1 Tax=Nonomuraea aurantiaca TaxID=2878562 RepID=UPI001CDA0D87|nr:bifunctional diaminohydroxyphosphoribosylaminopyrimidine deaminase/5-amino-6-(5-phosphoribosylamino)uracil reductase RibD [Nonomuraea aurantiaca]MCA2222733.1 bifunctional diaminohydroxyphosphoribosylaminopyrimidine deaminase/5-amino-6-(5-phosphoribosylamino)uracil reductase RibD [Nonomuraea aurantiaca]
METPAQDPADSARAAREAHALTDAAHTHAVTDIAHMARAVELAACGRGATSPNPVVGCVVLDASGNVAGEGFHAYAGGPHAEVVALREAGERARGGTAYVTLEPCDHTGRTGPCSLALLGAGIARVVVAVADPTPKAAGGAARLRAHGVVVESGLLAEEGERVNAEWLTYARLGRPYVTWKFAATLDGRSAAPDGTSQWITSPEARADVHRLRAESGAIIAGIGTVLADDPHLTARPSRPADASDPTGPADVRDPASSADASRPTSQDRGARPAVRVPLRVVVDSEARTPPGARVLDGAAPTLVAVADDVETRLKADLIRLPRHDGGLDLRALLRELAAREVVSVFLEGGPTLAGAFLRQGLIDRVIAYLAPALLGAGPAALGDAGVATIAATHRLAFDDVSPIGPDLRLTARPVPAPPRKES